jgi:hypothetical protein
MALSDILKKYGEEEGTQISQGIMFPFQKGVDSTSTTQQVYNSATDGIMTMEGKPYTGPTATIQYGTAEQGYPRMLREIEQGELPQFRQEDFPKVGEGITETPTPVTPPTTQPVEEEQPTIDPCPAGFVLDPVKGICVPIEQPRSDNDTEQFVDTRTNNEKAADILEDYGVKLTGEGGIFADPEKTKSVFGEFGKLPTFTQDDFDLGLPNLGPLTILANFLGKTFIGPFQLNNLTKLGVIEKTGRTIKDKDQYTLTENGVRAIVQAEVDKDKPRAERAVKPLMEKAGVTQRELEKGEGPKVDAFVKEYQERESKKYTDKQKNDFMKEVNKVRFKDTGGLKQIKSDKFTGEGFTRGR